LKKIEFINTISHKICTSYLRR